MASLPTPCRQAPASSARASIGTSLRHGGCVLACLAAALASTAVRAQEAPIEYEDLWAVTLGASLSRASGNTDASSIALQGDALRVTEESKWAIRGNGLYAKTEGTRTAEQARLGTRYDWNLTPWLFVFGGLDLERDEVALLNLRYTTSVGAGYRLFEQYNLGWEVFGGVGYVRDHYAEPRLVDDRLREDYGYPTALLGQESIHQFSATTSGKQRLTVLANLKDRGEYRAQWDLSLAVAMTQRWSLTVGLAWRYNSDPGPTLERADTLLTSGVSVKF
ncbi:MAG: DUF481 domain-containing protein [Burkholderiaceae bacterium]|nr:DUF481 domain-containing protein [Burkholderiaceae bacterium]